MKKRTVSVPSVISLALSCLLAAGAATFLGPCGHGGDCDRAGAALAALGVFLGVASLLSLLIPAKKARLALDATAGLGAAAAFFIPGGLMPICGMASMRCRMIMRPAGMVLSGLVFLFSMLALWMEARKKQVR